MKVCSDNEKMEEALGDGMNKNDVQTEDAQNAVNSHNAVKSVGLQFRIFG
jgi:hypothetical protein